jgi:osmotically-inducible protein OsmY
MTVTRRLLLATAASATATPAFAQLGNILLAPKTLVEHAVELRSFADQAKDNEIVLKVNAVMAKVGTLQADTEIYEQRLLITGLFDDKAKYDQFHDGVKGVAGIKKLYWHAVYESADDQKKDKALISWAKSTELVTKAGTNLTVAMKTTEQNYHVCVDSFAVAYIIGRAKTKAERNRAVASVRTTSGIKRTIDYVDVRP